ncbi:MAG: 4Fe-4S binding protein [Chitinispirillaceae bacterium]|nr:4Fe-4S binding protein [Chitinispirillaceae bacterium]
MTRKIRIVSQIIFFSLFVLFLFYFNREGLAQKTPGEWFLQLNPLTALLTSLASRTIIYSMLWGALIVTIVTLLFGRVFCGFVCPLGAAIDFTDKFIIGKARHISRRPHQYLQRLKYILLTALTALAILGLLFPFFMDPISIATRMITLIIDPAYRILEIEGKNFAAFVTSSLFDDAPPLRALDIAMPGSLVAAALFIAVFIGGFWDCRFWCQYVCPSGAFFGILSRIPILHRRINHEKCNSCRSCATRQCPTRAIDPNNIAMTSTAECILCGLCSSNTRACSVIAFSLPRKQEIKGPNLVRRHLIAGILAGIVAPPMIRGGRAVPASAGELIRPPGSLPESEFLTRCIACGECIKACPNHALNPCGFGDGLIRLNTPRLVPSIGYCEPSCTACTCVCPTVAIRPVSKNDKPFVKIGTAFIDEDRCLAWRNELHCLICMTRCPYQAIDEVEQTLGEITRRGPVVDKDLCIGCGKCETFCPVSTVPAIRLQSHGERRIMTGPFISNKKREKIARLRKEKAEENKREEEEEEK